MARKQKPDEPPPSKAYLVSFGDTMTALLAFFIVLLSLADDQSGINLHTGSGSFVRALNGLGLPGSFSGDLSARAMQQEAVSPLYMAQDLEDRPPDPNGTGPDEDNGMRVVDREEDVYKRFLNELGRLSKVESLRETEGEVVFDLFNQLNSEPPYLTSTYKETLLRVLPALRQDRYRVDLIVWATMPSSSAWERSAEKASALQEEVVRWARLNPEQQTRLRAMGKPWRYADVKRPFVSIVVRKLTPATP